MSSDRTPRRFVVLGLLALGGCGFVPIYRNDTGVRGAISFETDETVAGFRMRERLEERLGQTVSARYSLNVKISSAQGAATITSEGDTTRFNLVGTADWSLTDLATGAVADGGTVRTFTSYSATGSTVATQSAQTDAEARLSVALADMIVSRVLTLSANPDQ